jgi:hypothetical protein
MQIKERSEKEKRLLKEPCASCFSLFTFPKKLFAFCYLLSAFSTPLLAQTWEAGVFAGAAGYVGDLNQRELVKPSGPAVGAFVKRNFNPYLSVKLNLALGKIAGADSVSNTQQFRDRNLSFHTQLAELSFISEFNFMKYTPGALDDLHRFTPYIYFGAGVTEYNPQADYQGQTYDLRPLRTEGVDYPSNAIVIPYGAGIKYNFTGSWNVMFSVGYRYARTDYLDDVSGLYIDKNNFTDPVAAALSDRSGERTGVYIGVPGTQRGDLRGHDNYLFIGITLSFTFLTANCYY